jgi:hypothetical protein
MRSMRTGGTPTRLAVQHFPAPKHSAVKSVFLPEQEPFTATLKHSFSPKQRHAKVVRLCRT